MGIDFTALIKHLNHAIIITDSDYRIRFMSPAAETLFAISQRQAAGFELAALRTGSGTRFETCLRDTVQSGQPVTYRELVLDLPEQSRSITVDCTLSLIYAGEPLLLVEMTSLARIMRIAREEQLLNQQQANREVVRNMAHEIKNPLGGIRGAAQLLERELGSTDKELTQIIISEVDRLQNLVNCMLGPNRLAQKARTNIHEVLDRVTRLLEVETAGKLHIRKDYDPSLPELLLDKDQIIQAVLNIARNAWQAVGAGGELCIQSRARRRFTIGDRHHRLVIAISLSDNGPGIPAELREQIFYPLISGRSDGTGLGLSIAQTLINQHQGLIECDSEPGHTCFTLYLPVNTVETRHAQ